MLTGTCNYMYSVFAVNHANMYVNFSHLSFINFLISTLHTMKIEKNKVLITILKNDFTLYLIIFGNVYVYCNSP